LGMIFKEATGRTLVKHLNAVRIKFSQQLLADTSKSIKEIANNVGYNDIHAFIRQFKATINMTPSDYRDSKKII